LNQSYLFAFYHSGNINVRSLYKNALAVGRLDKTCRKLVVLGIIS